MSQIKKRWKHNRKDFKTALRIAMNNNKALAMMAIETYTAKQCRSHIGNIWYLLRKYPEARKDYNDNLFGKYLSGSSEIFRSLYFSAPDIYKKFVNKVPGEYAMGDALAVAYSVLKGS